MTTDDKVISLKFPVIPPHRLLAYLHDEIQLRTPPEHINFYWQWAKQHHCPWARLGGHGVVPCGLYGDEARYNQSGPEEKVLGLFVNLVLFRPASIRHSRFLVFSIRSCLCIGIHTLYPVLRHLTWSFHLAWQGVDEYGNQLCSDNSKFLVTELRGDLAWHKAAWQFKDYGWQSTCVCFWCQAKSKGSHLYTELGLSASWIDTIYDDTWKWVDDLMPTDQPLCAIEALVRVRICSGAVRKT